MSPDAPPPGTAGWSLLCPQHLQGPPHPGSAGFPAGTLLQRDGCVPSSLTAVPASQPGGQQGLSSCHCPRAAAGEVLVSRGGLGGWRAWHWPHQLPPLPLPAWGLRAPPNFLPPSPTALVTMSGSLAVPAFSLPQAGWSRPSFHLTPLLPTGRRAGELLTRPNLPALGPRVLGKCCRDSPGARAPSPTHSLMGLTLSRLEEGKVRQAQRGQATC